MTYRRPVEEEETKQTTCLQTERRGVGGGWGGGEGEGGGYQKAKVITYKATILKSKDDLQRAFPPLPSPSPSCGGSYNPGWLGGGGGGGRGGPRGGISPHQKTTNKSTQMSKQEAIILLGKHKTNANQIRSA
jgi:hypothetical protein